MMNEPENAPRILDEAEARRIIDEVKTYCGQRGWLGITVLSWWAGGQRWARNRASMTSDQRDIVVGIGRDLRGGRSYVVTNQLDSASLKGASEFVEYHAERWEPNSPPDMQLQDPAWSARGAQVWSDITFNRSAAENGRAVEAVVQRARAAGFFSAGYIESFGANTIKYQRDFWGRESLQAARATQAQCSMTVRHPKGTGSGWAGNSTFDFPRIDVTMIADVAFEKCMKSIDAVRLEPGRYQTILEPQATATFAQLFVASFWRRLPESGVPGPWLLNADPDIRRYRSKLGLKVVDERITIHHDPSDPVVGTHPSPGVNPVTLIRQGILTTLYNDYGHSLNELVDANAAVRRLSFKIDGTQTTLESMIESTKRGLLVSRVSQPELLDPVSLLFTGVTRDGLWLIENGQVTKAVRNFRWTESPLFIFNNIETIGMSVPIFRPVDDRAALADAFHNATATTMVPTLKVNDFSFTSTIDAI